jgi:crossover junction endodeoxyribonuclease RuvC
MVCINLFEDTLRVLGIDPGSRITGFGVVDKGSGGKLAHVTAGQLLLDPSAPLPERLLAISNALKGIIDEFKPDAMSIESVFFSKNVDSAIKLGEARGIPLLCAASSGVPVYEYAPRSIKQAVTGYGNATKEQVQKMVKMLLKTEARLKADAADALAIAICHIHHFRPGLEDRRLSTEGIQDRSRQDDTVGG